jgi:hypothetical protein
MRLTNTIRESFVRAAMQDVPFVDYKQQAVRLVEAELDKAFSERFNGVKRQDAAATGWLEQSGIHLPHPLGTIWTYAPSGNRGSALLNEIQKQLNELAEKSKRQNNQHDALRSKLLAVANSVTTRKALAAALPEFEKYLPADEPAAIRTLPVLTNVVAEFARAGWPKGKEAAA